MPPVPAIFGGGGGNVQVGIIVTTTTAQAQQQFTRLQSVIGGLRSRLSGLDLQFRGVDRILQFMAAGSIIAATTGFLKLAGEMERLQIRMGVFEGSAQKAADRLDQIIQLSATAPFRIQALADSFVKLRAAGLEPIVDAQGNGILKNLIDGVAAFGGSEEIFKRATIAIQQMAGKGVISMEELRQQLGEAIPNAIQLMAEGLGISVSQLVRDVSRGLVDFDKGITAFSDKLREKFAGAAELLSNTFFGAIKQVQNQIDILATTFVRAGGLDVFTAAIRSVTDILKGLNEQIKSGGLIQRGVESFFNFFKQNASAIASVVNILKDFISVLGTIAGAIASFIGAFPEFATGGLLGYVLFGRKGILVGGLIAQFSEGIASAVTAVGALVEGIFRFVKSYGIEDVAAGGIIGFLLFGKRGALIGVLFGLFEDAHRAFKSFMFELFRLLEAFAGGAAQVIRDIFTDKSITESFAKGFFQGANNFQDWFKRNFGDPKKGIKETVGAAIKGVGDDSRASAEGVNKLADSIKSVIEQVTKNRKEFEGKFGQANPIAGLGQTQIQQLERFEKMQQSLQARLSGARAGGSGVVQFIEGQENKLRDVDNIIKTLTTDIEKFTNAGDTTKAKQLQENLNVIVAEVKLFRDGLKELAAIENQKTFQKFSDQARELEAKLGDINAESSLDPVAQATANVEKQFAGMITTVTKLRNEVKELAGAGDLQAQASAKVDEIEQRLIKTRELALERARKLAQRQIDDASQSASRSVKAFEVQAAQLEAANKFDKVTEALIGVEEQYRQTFDAISDQIKDIRRQMEDKILTADEAEALIGRLEAVREKVGQTQSAAIERAKFETTAVGQLWRDVGDTIQGSVGDALEGIVNKTGNLKDVLDSFYRDITRAAINYLVKQAAIAAFPSQGGDVGAGLFGLFGQIGGALFAGGAAAKGTVVPSGVKMFKKGGLIRGPTMFGMAGEAGDEAIVPLARTASGEMGVKTTGRGGDQWHLTIHAVDGAGVRELFMKEGSALIDAIQARQRLNRGFRT